MALIFSVLQKVAFWLAKHGKRHDERRQIATRFAAFWKTVGLKLLFILCEYPQSPYPLFQVAFMAVAFVL